MIGREGLKIMEVLRRIIKFRLLPFIGNLLIRFLGITMRIETINGDLIESFWKSKRNVIIAFWHGRQLIMPLAYKGERASILISLHEDGEVITRTMEHFGFNAIRGSTSRKGVSALLKMIHLNRKKRGHDLVVTPDGPRGPRYVVQKGVIEIARLTQLPIFPLTFSASKKNS